MNTQDVYVVFTTVLGVSPFSPSGVHETLDFVFTTTLETIQLLNGFRDGSL